MILMILGILLGVCFSSGNRIEITLWRHMVGNGAHGSEIVPCAPEMVPSGPKMKPQLLPKSNKYYKHTIPTPSGTVVVLGAHAAMDISISISNFDRKSTKMKNCNHQHNNQPF